MKRCILAIFLITAFTPFARAQSAKEVVGKAIDSLGGMQNLESIKTLTGNGTLKLLGGFPGKYQIWQKAPDKLKTAWDIEYIQQERAFDGQQGWEKNASVRELVGRDLARLKREAVFDPLLTFLHDNVPAVMEPNQRILAEDLLFNPAMQLNSRKSTVNQEPSDTGAGADREAYVVRFESSDGEVTRFYFDTKTLLPLRESYEQAYEEGSLPISINYGDYRQVGNIKLPFLITTVVPDLPLAIKMAEYKINPPIDDSVFENPLASHAEDPYEVTLNTIPRHLYKENDGMWGNDWQRFWGIPFRPTESWLFNLLVDEKYGRYLEPTSASMEFYSGSQEIRSIVYSADALKASQKFPATRFAPQPEIFDFRYYGSEPVEPAIDRIVYKIELKAPNGQTISASKEIPLTHYQQKSKLIFPVRGNFMVANGHEFYELGHKYEWSQHYGYDIVGLGPDFELVKSGGKKNEDFVAYASREILAPADGTVVYARNNDVPDDMSSKLYLSTMPDPISAIGGNLVIIDHGDGEYSLFAHMHKGSVRVKAGDKVKQGQVIGLMGSAGSPGAPHLHYQLQAGPGLFNSDGLPSQFENIQWVGWVGTGEPIRTPKRGLYLSAK